ncbi:MAG: lactate utilization protein [Coriobacteriales bacterium]
MGHRDFSRLETSLAARGYTVRVFDTSAEATAYLDHAIDGQTVGFGGSQTLETMGLYELLECHNQVAWHHRVPAGKTADEMRAAASAASVYLSSVNSIDEQGEIVNIDYTGNRVASLCYGHEKVYLVVGENKVEPDLEHALHRARNVASPRNAQRLNVKTPCAVRGERCYDCSSPERICRALQVLWRKPASMDFEVVLVHEDLGF